jgi:hypothetical protein
METTVFEDGLFVAASLLTIPGAADKIKKKIENNAALVPKDRKDISNLNTNRPPDATRFSILNDLFGKMISLGPIARAQVIRVVVRASREFQWWIEAPDEFPSSFNLFLKLRVPASLRENFPLRITKHLEQQGN